MSLRQVLLAALVVIGMMFAFSAILWVYWDLAAVTACPRGILSATRTVEGGPR